MTTTSNSGYVLDASVALKWYLRDEDDVATADTLYDAHLAGAVTLISPNYVRYEVANGLAMASVQSRILADQVLIELVDFLERRIYVEEDADSLLQVAVRLSALHSITPYDALYLALAEATGFAFVTADRRLYRRIAGAVPYARWIGDVPVV